MKAPCNNTVGLHIVDTLLGWGFMAAVEQQNKRLGKTNVTQFKEVWLGRLPTLHKHRPYS